ncbi:MAG: ABC transporter ATP-binding protein, partial [Gammaproteobacteria bacterium]|nr:ABC transporter ATP-binding protein [Gammaproteobacteria bacterium]
GKSTALNLIAGIDLPDRGEVRVDGEVINRLSDKERTLLRRRLIGVVFQSFNLIPTLSVVDNVCLPCELAGMTHRRARERASHWLDAVGLATRGHSAPEDLSGGEQQRVAVARALANEPRIILADEPTGNLDERTGRQVLEVLQRLVSDGQRTLIMATHSQEAARLGQYRYRVSDGAMRLIEAP